MCPTHFHIRERDEGRNPVERTCVENGKICERLVLNKPRRFVTFIMNDYLQKNQFVVSEWKGERLTGQEMR